MGVGVRLASGPLSDRQTAAALRTGPPSPRLPSAARTHRPRDGTRRAIARPVLLAVCSSQKAVLNAISRECPLVSPPPSILFFLSRLFQPVSHTCMPPPVRGRKNAPLSEENGTTNNLNKIRCPWLRQTPRQDLEERSSTI